MVALLIIDGVKFEPWTPKDEEKEFHPMVREHSKEIFGENSLYFDVKRVLKAASGIGSIPDAFVIDCSKPAKLYVVENELSSHPLYDHIVKQLTKFINGLENQAARKQVLDLLYDEINKDDMLRVKIQSMIDAADVYHFLSKLLERTPTIVIIIDNKSPEVEEACNVLKYPTEIIEFKTFARENAENVKAHLFDSIAQKKASVGPSLSKKGEITSQKEYIVPILESLIEMGGKANVKDVLERIHAKMAHMLKEKDLEVLPSGKEVRWQNQARWQRFALQKNGYLRDDSPSGTWEITEEGRRLYESMKRNT